MTKDIQAAILRACARFIGKKIDPVEKRIGRLEERSASWLAKEHADFIIDNLTEEGRKKWVGIIPQGEKGERGDPGKDADPVSVSEVVAEILKSNALEPLIDLMVEERVVKYLAENPPPSGQPGKDGAPGRDGEKGESGKDGAGIADLLIDREGNLVATMTDGRIKSLGVVLGRDGAPGRDGKDGADFSKAEIDWEGERTLVIRGEGGEIRKTISVPMDKGYYREGMACEKADVVTHDGNAWIALRDTKAKPCHENKDDWRLFARKGRDGRDGKDGKPPPGPVRLNND